MSSYTTQLRVDPFDETMRRWILREEFDYVIGDLNADEKVTVPVGFITDFATIPRFLWGILPPMGVYGKACVVHDYLCTYKTIKTKTGDRKCTRLEGDKIFLEAMGVSNVNPMIKYAMFAGVRIYAILTGKK